jgi:MYXO-CTERM domain-containing protein
MLACLENRARLSPLAALVALFAAAALAPSRAHACMCVQTNVQAAYDGSAAVFEGFVKEVGEPQSDASDAGRRRAVRMEIVSAWKGAEGEQVTVFTAADSAMCGYTFQVERSYLVYAVSGPGGLEVSLCSRTRPMAEAGEDLAHLGMGATPVDPNAKPPPEPKGTAKADPPARGGCAGCAVAGSDPRSGIAALACMGLVLAVLGRRRRLRLSYLPAKI